MFAARARAARSGFKAQDLSLRCTAGEKGEALEAGRVGLEVDGERGADPVRLPGRLFIYRALGPG